MTYDLALELKNAGFPQLLGDETVMRAMDSSGAYAKVGTRMPTLEELIEACGDGFYELHRDTDDGKRFYWAAVADNDLAKYSNVFGTYGPTPTEAVANLWLALNKKGIE